MTLAAVPGQRALAHGIAVTHLVSRDGARATVADHGAHLLSWQPAGGGERLYLSPASGFASGQAIRGGVPIIFPQFGERGAGRRHGIARLQAWQFEGARHEGDAAVGVWRLAGLLDRPAPMGEARADGAAGEADAQYRFGLTLTVRVAGNSLAMSLRIDNTGSKPWQAHAALHTYLAVPDLAQARIEGLQGVSFIDNAEPAATDRLQPGEAEPLRFTGERDRLYPAAPSSLLLASGSRQLQVSQSGFADTVVWNPGPVKAAALSDLPAGGHAGFVCIESAAVLSPVTLAPGTFWEGGQRLQADSSPGLP